MNGDISPGDVIRYKPESRWCHDGYAVAVQRDDHVVLVDTYWTTGTRGSGGRVVSPETFEFVCNLGDYEEKAPDAWEMYAPSDRVWIPRHAGYRVLYLVRKGAQPDLATQIQNARERLMEAEEKVRSAQHLVDWRRQELAELEALAVAS